LGTVGKKKRRRKEEEEEEKMNISCRPREVMGSISGEEFAFKDVQPFSAAQKGAA